MSHSSCPASADNIAKAVLDRFDRLPAKSKPVQDSKGKSNWVPLSGIVAESGKSIACAHCIKESLNCGRRRKCRMRGASVGGFPISYILKALYGNR